MPSHRGSGVLVVSLADSAHDKKFFDEVASAIMEEGIVSWRDLSRIDARAFPLHDGFRLGHQAYLGHVIEAMKPKLPVLPCSGDTADVAGKRPLLVGHAGVRICGAAWQALLVNCLRPSRRRRKRSRTSR